MTMNLLSYSHRFRHTPIQVVQTCPHLSSSTDAKTHFIKLDFINKGIDVVNLPSILRSKSVTETVPTYFKEKEPPYTYTKTIASKIFNFSSV